MPFPRLCLQLLALGTLACGVSQPNPGGGGGAAPVPTGGSMTPPTGGTIATPGSGGAVGSGGSGPDNGGVPPATGGSGGPAVVDAGGAGSIDARPPVVVPPGPPLPAGGPFGAGATSDKVVVFVHIGHSNMAGRATSPDSERPYFYSVDPHLWSFGGTQMITGTMPYLWRPAKEPLSPDAMTGNMAGPGMAILHAAQMMAPADTHFVSIGHGHSGMEGGHCQSYQKGGLLYEIAMGPARALKGRVIFGGVFTMLGTTERHYDAATQTGFAACMQKVAADMRADLGDPNIPFMMSDFEMEATADTSPTLPYAKVIIAQLRVAQMMIPRSALIPTDKISMQDSHHFNMAGHHDWAMRGMTIMKTMGWAATWAP